MQRLDTTDSGTDSGPKTGSPTAILMAEHRVIEMVLDCLEKIADTASAPDGLAIEDALRAVDFIKTFADTCHHGKEEVHLFPMLERHGLPADVGPTSVMRAEHEMGRRHVREMTAALASLADDPAADAAAARETFVLHARGFVMLLREHIMKEDQVLFPMADRMIPPEGHTELLAAFGRVENDEIGAGVHEEYLALAGDLCERYGVEAREPKQGDGTCFSCGHG